MVHGRLTSYDVSLKSIECEENTQVTAAPTYALRGTVGEQSGL